MGCGASTQAPPEPEDPNAALREELRALQQQIREKEEHEAALKAELEKRRCESAYLNFTARSLELRKRFLGRELQATEDEHSALLSYLAHRDALGVEAASAGWGTDEKAMAHIIMRRTRDQLRRAQADFLRTFGKSMAERVSSENRTLLGKLTGEMTAFGKLLTLRLRPKEEQVAYLVHRAVKGLGADDKVLLELLSSCSNEELRGAAAVYARMHKGEDMVERVTKETSGLFSRHYGAWVRELLEFDRRADTHEDRMGVGAADEARRLYEAGAAKWMGCDEEVFIEVLAKASPARCAAIEAAYAGLPETKHSLREDVAKNLAGDLEFGVLARLTPRLELLASRVKAACDGLGTDKNTIARVFGMLSLKEVGAFQRTFDELNSPGALFRYLDHETHGDFRWALNQMLTAPSPTGTTREEGDREAEADVHREAFLQAVEGSYSSDVASEIGEQWREDGADSWHAVPPFVVTPPPLVGCDWPALPYVSQRSAALMTA